MIIHYHSLIEKGDVLPHLWQRMLADEPPPWIWGNAGPLSLTDFICYFADPQRHLFLVCTSDAQDFIGLCWMDEMILGQRARGHFYFFKKYRAKPSARIPRVCKEILGIISQPPFDLKLLLLFTDSRATDVLRAAPRHFGAVYLPQLIPRYYPGESVVHVGYVDLKGLGYGITLRTTADTDRQYGNHGNGHAVDGSPGSRGPDGPPPQRPPGHP